jgi:hypothetical protein
MITSQQEADELLREPQERYRRDVTPECCSDTTAQKINDGGLTIQQVERAFAVLACLASVREQLRAPALMPVKKPLPRYVTRT